MAGPTPTINSVTPNNSLTLGNIPVTVSTSYISNWPDNFLTFGGVPCTNFVWVDASTITCNVPPHAPGVVDVVITNSGTNGGATLVGGFTYTGNYSTVLTGGNFQDLSGNPLANGYLTFRLNTDAAILGNSSNVQVSAGVITRVTLDSNGNVSGVVPVWPNDILTPSNTVYIVKAYSAAGELCWSSENVIPSGGTFDIGTWIPSY
jgi:hypothetical protein